MLKLVESLRGMGAGRLRLLAYVTGGHTAIHWYQQIFAVVLPSISQSFHLTDVQVGYLQSARQLTSGTLNLPVGMVADAHANRQGAILASAIAAMGAGYFVLGSASGLPGALVGAALIGVGSAVWHPPAMGALSSRFPERRATALAVHGVGATVSDTLTPLAIGALLVAFAWPRVLRAQALPALLAALLLWWGLAGQFRTARAPGASRGLAGEVGAVAIDPTFIGISVAQGLMMMARQVVLTFFPLYIQVGLGRNAFELGVYVALLHGMGTASQPVLGVLSDRLGRKAVLIPSYVVLTVLYLLVATVAPGVPLGLVVLAIGIFFYTLTNITSAAVLDAVGSRVQASAFGLNSVMTQVLVLPAPIVAGWLVERYGYGSAFWLSAAFMAVGALIMAPLSLYRGTRTPGMAG